MDEKKARHILAEYNESIDTCQENLRNMNLRLYTCKESEKVWYLENIKKEKEKLEIEEQEKEAFINKYSSLIR